MEEEPQRLREERSNWLVAGRAERALKGGLCRCPVRPSLERASAGTGRSRLLERRLRGQPLKESSAVAAQTAERLEYRAAQMGAFSEA